MTDIPKFMQGIQLTGYGNYNMQQYSDDIAVPKPRANEVLIQVLAAGVNNTDINTRIGWYAKGDIDGGDASWAGRSLEFPRVQGADVCGRIVAVGDNIDSKRIGERVLIEPCITQVNGEALNSPWYFGSECDGGFADYTVVSDKHAHAVQSSLSDVELASFPCSYSTAENMLTKAAVVQTDCVLISGASGGVGSAAIQLAKARGAYVIAMTSPSKSQQLLDLGADHVIERNANLPELLGENSIDVVIDLVAGEQWPQFLQVLRPSGRYAVAGAIAGAHVELDVRTLYLKDLSFFGCTVLSADIFKNLIKHIESGKIAPLIAKTFPLKEINTAQTEFLQKKHVGKIVLTVAGSEQR